MPIAVIKDSQERSRQAKEFVGDYMPGFLRQLETRLKLGGGKFFVGNQVFLTITQLPNLKPELKFRSLPLADRRRSECLQLYRLPDRSELPGFREHQERHGGAAVRHLRRVQAAQEQLQGGRLDQGGRQLLEEEARERYVIRIMMYFKSWAR